MAYQLFFLRLFKLKRRGFTLIELLVTLALLAILLLMAAPLGEKFYHANVFDARVSEVLNAVEFAKSKTILSNKPVVLSKLDDDWSVGMQLYLDIESQHRLLSKEQLIREWRFNHQGPKLLWRGFLSNDFLLFSPEIGESALSGRFIIKSKSKEKQIIINKIGRVRLE